MAYKKHETIIDDKNFSMFRFSSKSKTSNDPIYIQPPFAGRGGDVCQNLIDKCSETSEVYCFDLKSAKPFNNFGISEFVGAIDKCQTEVRRRHNVESLSVASCCQGGWVTAIHNALNPHLYRKHALFASPINCKTGEANAIEDYCKTIDLAEHQQRVDLNFGVQRGIFQWLAFSSMDPYETYCGRWFKLQRSFWSGDTEKFKKDLSNNIWHDNTKDLGKWFMPALKHHFTNNELYDGTWIIDGRTVNLGDITSDMFVYSGKDDKITNSKQAEDILRKVSSLVKHYTDFDNAGHTRVFTGKAELDHFAIEFFN